MGAANAATYPPVPSGLTRRWTELKPHAKQQRIFHHPARWKICPAGRRSGKTELAKRKIAACGMSHRVVRPDWAGRYIVAAPTLPQAKRIFWKDLRALVIPDLIARIHFGELVITMKDGTTIEVHSLDRPERIEGAPIDGIAIDEFGNVKSTAWAENIRPALSTLDREGWAWVFGVPEGRDHYFKMWRRWTSGELPDAMGETWFSSDVIAEEEVEEARRDMDPATFRREYQGSFEGWTGRVYETFDVDIHGRVPLAYRADEPLLLTFDFNVKPGTSNALQNQKRSWAEYSGTSFPKCLDEQFTACIGEVWKESGSRSRYVAQDWCRRFASHTGPVLVYGDVSGGASHTSQTEGSDWDIVMAELRKVFGSRVRSMVHKVGSENPRERARVNAMNGRFLSANDKAHFMIDPKCIHTIDDFEGVAMVEDGSGKIDKKRDKMLTHLSDGIGYWAWAEHKPTRGVYGEQVS